MADSTPYTVPPEPGRWSAIGLAAVVHAVLFAILWIGVRWENEAPTAVEAEIWTEQAPQTSTPRSQPAPEPIVQPEPKPQPVIKELPKPVQKQPEPPVKDPEIALEQERKRKLLEQQAKLREQEVAKAEKQKIAAELKQAEADKQRKLQQAEAEQRQKQQQAEAAAKLKQEQAAAAEKKRKQQLAEAKAAQAAADKAAADERHAENLKRLMTQAGAGSTSGGTRAQGGGGDAGYVDRIRTKIRSNTIFNVPAGLAGNPEAEYAIDLLPDGSLRGLRKLKSSGVPGFDEAVASAIERSLPFPPDSSGKVPPRLTISHRPKDQ